MGCSGIMLAQMKYWPIEYEKLLGQIGFLGLNEKTGGCRIYCWPGCRVCL
jgi:hypothetical protein